jgi:CheY-like chemotaxis protein
VKNNSLLIRACPELHPERLPIQLTLGRAAVEGRSRRACPAAIRANIGDRCMSKPFALIIEDDEDLAMIFSGALQEVGFETEIISDGQEAVDQLANIIPAVVVLDLHLPNVPGKDILRQIRADKRLSKTRIILATADTLIASELRAEVDLVLIKPISFDQLSILGGTFQFLGEF